MVNSITSGNLKEVDEPTLDMLGDNKETTNKNDVPVVPQSETVENPESDKYQMALDAIRKTWSEVKLLQMKSSVVKFYLNKNNFPKGDNIVLNPPDPPVQHTCSGRPIRKTTGVLPNVVDTSENDSDYMSDFVKSPNRKRNLSKPRASGPSASRVASQNRKSGVPLTVLPSASNVYKRSDSPD